MIHILEASISLYGKCAAVMWAFMLEYELRTTLLLSECREYANETSGSSSYARVSLCTLERCVRSINENCPAARQVEYLTV